MSGHKKEAKLRAQSAAHPWRTRKIEILSEVYNAVEMLALLRRRRRIKQATVARRMHVSQPVVSQIEEGTDPRVSTLAEYVEALGGELRVLARFRGPDGAREEEIAFLPEARRRLP